MMNIIAIITSLMLISTPAATVTCVPAPADYEPVDAAAETVELAPPIVAYRFDTIDEIAAGNGYAVEDSDFCIRAYVRDTDGVTQHVYFFEDSVLLSASSTNSEAGPACVLYRIAMEDGLVLVCGSEELETLFV